MRKKKVVDVNVTVDFTRYIGGIIDADFEDFKNCIERDKVPVGVLANTKVMLIGMYNELINRKDEIIKRVNAGELTKEEVLDTVKEIYAELTKIEMKVLYLQDRIKDLSDVG